IERGCAGNPLTTGYNAMIAAGFTPAGDDHDGPAYVCRIDDDPPPSQESCVDTPPIDASWSYWHADAGQNTWMYSSTGAMGYEPPPGSVDAWIFGVSDPDVQPPFSPASVRANNPGPPVTTTTTTSPDPTSDTTTSTSIRRTTSTTSQRRTATTTTPKQEAPTSIAASISTSTTEARGGATTGSTATSKPSSASTTTPGSSGTAHGSTTKIVNVSAVPAPAATSAGSDLPFLIGVVVVVCLAGAGGFAAWRRKRAEAG
ncbi:MAG: hypothetical protein WAM97_18040, partial [Acidimicrobiales bacterium]